MGVAIKPSGPLVRQPQGNFELAEEWTSATAAFVAQDYELPLDIVSRKFATIRRLGYPTALETDVWGVGLRMPSTSTGFRLTQARDDYGKRCLVTNATPFTFFIYGRFGTTTNGAIFGRYHNNSGDYEGAWQIRKEGFRVMFRYISDHTGTDTIYELLSTDFIFPSNTERFERCIAGSFQDNRVVVYVDGSLQIDAAIDPATGTGFSVEQADVAVGADTALYNNVVNSVYAAGGVADRRSSKNDLRYLSSNPFSFFKKPASRLIFLPSLAAFPTLSAAFASSITTGSIAPNVTVTF